MHCGIELKFRNRLRVVDRPTAESARCRDYVVLPVLRQRFESRLANALDMAEGEPEVIDVIERSFASVLPGSPAELLLADNSHAHLRRAAGQWSGESTPHPGGPAGAGPAL